MSSSILLQQYPACLVRLILIVFVIGGRWPYSCCFVECCLQELFSIDHSILVQLPSSFFSIRFVSVQVVHPYSSIDTTAAWKKLCFISSVMNIYIYIYIYCKISINFQKYRNHNLFDYSVQLEISDLLYIVKLDSKFGDLSRGWPKVSLLKSYYTVV